MTIGKLLAAVEGKSAKTCSCTNFGIFSSFFLLSGMKLKDTQV
jgi:hypothetical protein